MASSNCGDVPQLWVEKLLRFQAKTYRSQWCHTWVHSCLCPVAQSQRKTHKMVVLWKKNTACSRKPIFRQRIYLFYLFIYLSINLFIYSFIHLFIYLYIQVAIKTLSLPRHHNLRRWTFRHLCWNYFGNPASTDGTARQRMAAPDH